MRRYNAQGLFQSSLYSDRFIDNISVSPEEQALMRQRRDLVREAIRREFHEIGQAIKNSRGHLMVESMDNDTRRYVGSVVPKFWGQGSVVYKTLNAPAKNPPQQIDIDDGVYLPMTIMSDMPVVKKQIFFQIVDSALKKLCQAQKWEFREKDTCGRVIVNDRMHIDVPLYAIPDNKYREIALNFQESRRLHKAEAFFMEESFYLDEKEIYLALRNREHWIKSDPMEIQKWYERAIRKRGEILRRVCRYLKAWRDQTWLNGGPSSIALMVCAVQAFGENRTFETDCEAFLAVAKALPGYLNEGVYIENQEFYPKDKSHSHRVQEIQQAQSLAATVSYALESASTTIEVVAHLRNIFGERMPNRPDWVSPLPVAPSVRRVRPETQREPRDMSHNLTSG